VTAKKPTPTKKMNTTRKEIEFQIWQLSRAIAMGWRDTTPDGIKNLELMKKNLRHYKAMLPFAK
jgi:hypothetical protein